MFDPFTMIVATVIATVVGYTIIILLLWQFWMPGYLYHKIRLSISDCTVKSCFNCKNFKEQYYNTALWCEEVGEAIEKVHRKCEHWKLRTFDDDNESELQNV